jgi:Carboxypeptidase regulatory-like domain/TonB dependent receptor
LLVMANGNVQADSGSTLTGRVTDPSGKAVPRAAVMLHNSGTLVERTATTNSEGIFEIPALPVGTYRMQVRAPGFRLYTVEALTTEVARTRDLDVRLEVGEISEEVTVRSQAPLIDGATTSVGHVIDDRMVQEMPLNGRYLLDLAVLSPGSVTASQAGFNTMLSRGLGSYGINTAGNREDAVNYVINGITLNDQLFSGIMFQQSISTVQEFKIDNSTLSAEYGHSSAVVNVATRSGTSEFHGELFEFLRNGALDARNFFEFTSNKPPPFQRNQFGANLGGPIVKGRTFFFVSYEGLRLVQNLDLNSVVLSDVQRQSAGGTVIARLVSLIPRANFVDSSGTPRFIGSAPAPVNGDQWGMDVAHVLNQNDTLHGYYSAYLTKTIEPDGRGTTIPDFGYVQPALRQFFSLAETHSFGGRTNEVRFGLNRQSSSTRPAAPLDPVDFGINDGITQAVGLPQINIAGGALNFGGPSTFPSGRGDTTFVLGDTVSSFYGRHSIKIGGEYRQFLNNNFRLGSGAFNFASVAAFVADNANSFSVTLGSQSSAIAQGALGFFAQDDYKWRPNVTLELGLRYDWNMTPSERYDRFIVFKPQNASIVRLGRDDSEIYHQNTRNFQPRVGFAWDPFKDGKTAVRGAYGIFVNQPITNVVAGTAGNPPLASPLIYSGTIGFENAINLAQAAGLAPMTVDRGFDNAYLQSWNLNVQREVSPGLAVLAGYFGSAATHLTLSRNINQPVGGLRPYPSVSASSQILPGVPLGNITQMESTGTSSYNALWLSANQRLARGLQMTMSYTWSKSLDDGSLSSQGVVVQNSYNLRGDRGLSDYNASQRFVANAIYELPFRGSRWMDGWQLAAIVQMQTGNPVNIVTSNSTLTGVANTLRPNVTGPIPIFGNPDRWFDGSVFTPVAGFGDLGRNVVIGPGSNNTDFSITKYTKLTERMRVQLRAEVFDLLNHPNFGNPGNVAAGPNFGRITSTRFPTGESGSSRQVQFAMKLIL